MKYTVVIEETLKRRVTVEASDAEEALRSVKGSYFEEDIVLDSSDFDSVNFIPYEV